MMNAQCFIRMTVLAVTLVTVAASSSSTPPAYYLPPATTVNGGIPNPIDPNAYGAHPRQRSGFSLHNSLRGSVTGGKSRL